MNVKTNALQRILGPQTGLDGEIPDEDGLLERRSYCRLRGRHRQLAMLKLINRQGRVRTFDYTSLTGSSLDRSDELVLHFDGREAYTIVLRGWNLGGDLLDGIDSKRVIWVRELEELTAEAARNDDPADAVVTQIVIETEIRPRTW